MSSGNTVYDYGVIEQCNQIITQKVNGMQETAERFKSDVARLVAETWGGQAAGGYEASADRIRTDLEDRKNTLINLGKSLSDSSTAMQDTDGSGRKHIEASV